MKQVHLHNTFNLCNNKSDPRISIQTGLTEVCSPRHENVGLLAYSPLCGGLLTGKYRDPVASKTARMNLFEGYMTRYKQSLAQEAVEQYCEIAKKHNMTPTELTLGWVYNQEHVASTIIGATTLTQLRENLGNICSHNTLSI